MGLRYPGGYVTDTFNPLALSSPSSAAAFPIEVFVLAGGGGGATGDQNGGGGAGGAIYNSNFLTYRGLNYLIAIGAGGATGTGGVNSNPGVNSTFSGNLIMTAVGGGFVGGNTTAGGSGGCGGAAGGYNASVPTSGGASTQTSVNGIGYGNKGGDSVNTGTWGGPGGGGLGASGGTAVNVNANGGIGLANWSTWCAALTAAGFTVGENSGGTYYLGGGGGGGSVQSGLVAASGGLGGGGAGGTGGGAGTAGTAKCGAGGGGGKGGGGAGGAGVLMIRYPDSLALPVSISGSPTTTTSGGYRYYGWSGAGSITF